MRVIEAIRRELEPLNAEIRAALRPSREALVKFVANQLYIVPHDLKALSAAMAKAREPDEYRFVKALVDGDYNALQLLWELAEEVGVSLSWDALDPSAVAYTHFLSWLAVNGTMGDLAVAMTVNLPVWGENCLALARWAKEQGYKRLGFLEMFAGPYDQLEAAAEAIAQRYLDWGRYRFVAKAIQRYELEFWRSVSG
ncbi:MAG: TenA family transcriptional regulator [Pyrobaculum arsenaticum]|uniref:Transcriptional activator, TenA family n=2 Tax=Pyrobaculum arsenaticum TaxID=121277 RepID=A4WMW6_PYRAR|nr:TenA family transcriptional regulator [Pyrobaculum arsenaticum]ABP51733.1 transcriptional activator, TenA family [Pyrobaculum arsenaticum DSM 13514]MCY0890073.1 TenA family transcriptional regulator [Pyrobaculum arsenaticum]NYR16053.1 TenA family transcriptional regulator [Pyrobaculum arsenaticum]